MPEIIIFALVGIAFYVVIRNDRNTRSLVEGLQSSIWELKDELNSRSEELKSTRREFKLELLKETGHERFIEEMTLPQAIQFRGQSKEVFEKHGLICKECGMVPDVTIEEAAKELDADLTAVMSDLGGLQAA